MRRIRRERTREKYEMNLEREREKYEMNLVGGGVTGSEFEV